MRNIIITGAAGNLGKSAVAAFENADYHLSITAREAQESNERKTVYPTDLSDVDASARLVADVVKNRKKIDGAILLVGAYTPGGLLEASMADLDKMMTLNVKTALNVIQPLLRHFRQTGGGKIVFVGAKTAMNPATAIANVAYALSKQVIFHYAELINESEKSYGTSAHVFLPTTLDTPLNRQLMPDADFSTWTNTDILSRKMRDVIEGIEKSTVIFL